MIRATHLDLTHLDAVRVPVALAELHGKTVNGARFELGIDAAADRASDIVRGAGFSVERITEHVGDGWCSVAATRQWELPDHVGPDMRVLLVGLNPSPAATDAGVGFARPGNRFWPALLASGLATLDRDPSQLLDDHRIGMTDLVARTTARAAELADHEFATGIDRLERLVGWLRPGIVCFVGLQGWRTAIDRRATAGPQTLTIAGRPTYLMPNPSGLNANHRLPDFVEHFAAVAALAATDAIAGSPAPKSVR